MKVEVSDGRVLLDLTRYEAEILFARLSPHSVDWIRERIDVGPIAPPYDGKSFAASTRLANGITSAIRQLRNAA